MYQRCLRQIAIASSYISNLIKYRIVSDFESDLGSRYKIDVSSGQLLIGDAALDAHIDMGGHPLDVHSLYDALTDRSIPVVTPPKASLINNAQKKRAMRQQAISDLEVLYPILRIIRPEDPKMIMVNEEILIRAYSLGLFAISLAQVQTVFGNTSNLYKATDINEASIRYPALTPQKTKELLYDFYQKHGRMPSVDEVNENPSMPSYQTLWSRLPDGLNSLAQEFGEQRAINMGTAEITWWGLCYLLRNQFIPTQAEIEFMSMEGVAPSASIVARRFSGKLVEFQDTVISAHDLWGDIKSVKLQELEEKRLTQKIPLSLLTGDGNGHTLLTRYARYQILDHLLDTNEGETARLAADDQSDHAFLSFLKERFSSIDERALSEIALDLGYDKNMWREVPRNLKLDEVVVARLDRDRGEELSEKENDQFEQALATGVDFYILHGLTIPRNDHIVYLQKRGLLPGPRIFKRLFQDPYYFRLLIKARGTKEWRNRQNERQKLLEKLKTEDFPSELFLNIKLLGEEEKVAVNQTVEFLKLLMDGEDVRPPKSRSGVRFRIRGEGLSEDEKLVRVARYTLVSHLLPDMPVKERIPICLFDRSRSIIGEIVKRSEYNITPADIELAAASLNIDRYIMFPDKNYLKRIKYRVLSN